MPQFPTMVTDCGVTEGSVKRLKNRLKKRRLRIEQTYRKLVKRPLGTECTYNMKSAGVDPTVQHRMITDGGQTSADGGNENEYDRLEQLNKITQVTRANLIQNIIGHKWWMPSKKELDYYNPSMSSGNVSNHLKTLEEVGIIDRVVIPHGDRVRDAPSVFYILNDRGYGLLRDHSLFLPELEDIREDHARMEKSEEIHRYENAPRPTVAVGYDHPLKGDGVSVVQPEEYVEDTNFGGLSSPDDDDRQKKIRHSGQ